MAESTEKKFHYGGQAVIEGVMMRGPKDFAVAVRRADGEIVSTTENIESSILGRMKWLDKPLLRGTLALIDAMTLGIKALKYSADVAMADAVAQDRGPAESGAEGSAGEVPSDAQAPDADSKPQSGKVNDMAVGAMMVLGLALGVVLFFLVPIFIVKPFTKDWLSWQRTAAEGGIKIAIFVLYVSVISLLPDIRRVFQYHGAEHKTINAYEANVELTPENVIEYNKAHVRCGTSFILVVLVTSIIVFMFVPTWTWYERLLYKLAFLPLIAGIAYEVIRFAGSRKDSLFTRMLVLPGLTMQKITTREPDPQMIEVAIRSLKGVLEVEESKKQQPAEAAGNEVV